MKINSENFRKFLLSRSKLEKIFLILCFDGFLAVFSTWVAFGIRLGDLSNFFPLGSIFDFWLPASASVVLTIFTNSLFGAYQIVNRLLSIESILTALKAFLGYSFVFAGIFTVLGIENVPRTVGCIQPFILLTFIVATRLIAYFLNSKVKAKTGSDENATF